MLSRSALVLASVTLIAAMFLLVPWLTRTMGPAAGYLTVFCIYWFGFCLPLGFSGGPVCLNSKSASLSGSSAEVMLPCGSATR
jgi:hypothetical protein